jgi:hypothetical protein
VTDILDTIASMLDERQAELRPLIAEYEMLLVAAAVLDGAYTPPPPIVRRLPGRPKGSGKGAGEVLAAIRQQPGITRAELAEKTTTRPDYVSFLLRALVNEGKIIKNEGYELA